MVAERRSIGDMRTVEKVLSQGWHNILGTDDYIHSDGKLRATVREQWRFQYPSTRGGNLRWRQEGVIDEVQEVQEHQELKPIPIATVVKNRPWWHWLKMW